MLEQFKTLSSHITNRPQAIGEIKGGLREEKRENGAFYCTLPGFRDAYRIIRRGMERNGSVCILIGVYPGGQQREANGVFGETSGNGRGSFPIDQGFPSTKRFYYKIQPVPIPCHVNEDMTVRVANSNTFKLPSTGGIGTTLFTLLGTALILGSGAVLVGKKKKEDEE